MVLVVSGKIECYPMQCTVTYSYSSRKSQLAIEFAHTWKSSSPDGWVFWIHASSAERFDHNIRDVLGLLKVHGRESPHANLHELFWNWLIDTRGRRWLIVLDNADEANYLLEPPTLTNQSHHSTRNSSGDRRLDYIPTCDHGTLLITTRRRDMCLEMVHRNHMLEIRPMNAEHALEMMQKKIGMQDQKDVIIHLATALDFMPLAMAQAAAYIHKRAPRCSVQQYTEKLHRSQKSKLSLLNRDETDLRRDREASKSILSTWQISFEHVRHVRPSAADLLSFMSFFDRQAIPEALLLALIKYDSIDSSENGDVNDLAGENRSDSQSDSSSSKDEIEEDIQLLRDYSFISVTSDPAVFKMHALVQLATQKWLGGNARYSEWRNKFFQVLHGRFPNRYSPDWPKAKALFPHAFAALQLDAAGTYAQPLLASLLCNAGRYAFRAYAFANAERMLSTSLVILTQLFGNGHSQSQYTMYLLAMLYSVQIRWEDAEQLFLQVLSLMESPQEQDRNRCARYISKYDVMFGLSLMYRSQGRLDEAEQLLLQVLELADDHENTMVGLQNLGTTYSLQGRWEEAEQLLLQAVEIGKKADGAYSDSTLSAMRYLGRFYLDQGRLHEAERTFAQTYGDSQTVLGSDHPATLSNMRDISRVYVKQGRLDEAELAFSRVQESMSTFLESDHLKALSNEEDLARVYLKQGRLDEAKILCTHVVELKQSTLGMDHPSTLNTRELVWHLESQQECSEATVVSAQVLLDARTRVLGIAHPDTLSSMENLAWALHQLGRKRSATDLIGRCATLSSETLGSSHPRSARRNARARDWEAEDSWEENVSSAESSRSGSVTPEEERKAEESEKDELLEESAADSKGIDEERIVRSGSHVEVWLMPEIASAGPCKETPTAL
jgi:tetratricopeptide (TPR) repeat protein